MPKRWREVAPWQWQEVGGDDRLGAVVKDGKVAAFAPAGFAPIFLFVPATGAMNAGWIFPVMLARPRGDADRCASAGRSSRSPVGAIKYQLARRRARPLMLHRATRLTAWLMLVVGGWMGMMTALSSDVAYFDGRLDIWMRLLQLLSLAAIVGTLLAVWNAWTIATGPEKRRLATVWAVVIARIGAVPGVAGLRTSIINYSTNFGIGPR